MLREEGLVQLQHGTHLLVDEDVSLSGSPEVLREDFDGSRCWLQRLLFALDRNRLSHCANSPHSFGCRFESSRAAAADLPDCTILFDCTNAPFTGNLCLGPNHSFHGSRSQLYVELVNELVILSSASWFAHTSTL